MKKNIIIMQYLQVMMKNKNQNMQGADQLMEVNLKMMQQVAIKNILLEQKVNKKQTKFLYLKEQQIYYHLLLFLSYMGKIGKIKQ